MAKAGIAIVCVLALMVAACGGGDSDDEPPIGQPVLHGSEPVSFEFAPDGRLFFNLRQRGQIRWFDMNTWDPDVVVDLRDLPEGELFATEDVRSRNECGLLGLTLDPEFETNHFVYVYVTQTHPTIEDVAALKVIRYTDVDGVGEDRTVLLELMDTAPGFCAHVGGGLHFGLDGYLYLSIGNNEQKELAGGLDVRLGKFLRFSKEDGSPAPDNPYIDEPGVDPLGAIYAPDNGPGNCDELNLIERRADYGVPGSLPGAEAETCLGLGGTDPIYFFTLDGKEPEERPSNVAPAGMAYLPSGVYDGLGDALLVCEFLTGNIRYLEISSDGEQIARDLVLLDDCRFNVAVDGEGIIFYSWKDRIYRVPPELISVGGQDGGD
jgi:glucose/arabinose dehydrogenase